MSDPLELRGEMREVLEQVAREAEAYVEALPGEPVQRAGAEEALIAWDPELPEAGDGALRALAELLELAPHATRSSGPRFFHFVMGGGTPAALGADWLASALDQVGVRMGILAPRRAARGGCDALAARAVRAARRPHRDIGDAAQRWPTSPACSPPEAGGPSAREWTRTRPVSAPCHRP